MAARRPPQTPLVVTTTAGAVEFRQWVIDRKLSYGAVAKLLDCSKSYVAMLANNAAPPGLNLAARIETLCGIPCISWTQPSTPG